MSKLHELFHARREYMQELVRLGRLPEFPLILGTREGQSAIKEIGGYFIEELAEAHQVYKEIFDNIDVNNQEAAQHAQAQFNEEIIDCLNFMFEIMILANIDEHAVLTFMEKEWEYYLPLDGDYDPWVSLLQQIRRINITSGINFNYPHPSRFTVSLKGLNGPPQLAAGRVIGLETIEVAERLLWQITYCLKLAENLLKNKPWREDHVQTDFKDYHSKIMYTFFNFMSYCEAMGADSDSLYEMFNYKHTILFKRIKEKY